MVKPSSPGVQSSFPDIKYCVQGQLWNYCEDTLILENNKGNWMYPSRHWTEVPGMYNMDNMKTMYIETVDKFPSDEKTNRRVLTIDGACRTGVDILQTKARKCPWK